MDYFLENWGSFAGVLGVIVSAVGVWYAFLARRAAKSAEQASIEAKRAVTRTLSLVDVVRAVALINHLKEIHYQGNWAYALRLYGDLRGMLNGISASMPTDWDQLHSEIDSAVSEITLLWDLVNRSRYENQNGGPEDIPSLDETLSRIQQTLETLQSSMMYADEGVNN